MEWGGLWWLIDTPVVWGCGTLKSLPPPPPASLPALGSYREVASAAPCGLSPQGNLLATHACHASALAWRGCCFLSPGSLNTETIWWLLGGGGLPEGRQNEILLGFYLRTCYSRHSQRGRHLGTEMEWRDRMETRRGWSCWLQRAFALWFEQLWSLAYCKLADTWLLVPGAQS